MAVNGTWTAWATSAVDSYTVKTATFTASAAGTDDTYSETFSLDTTKLALLNVYTAVALGNTLTLTLQCSFDTGSTWYDISSSWFTTDAIASAVAGNSFTMTPANFDAPLYRLKSVEGGAFDTTNTAVVKITQRSS